MTHTYQVSGMTCGNCEATVKSRLGMLPDVTAVEVSRQTNSATVSMDRHIPLAELQKAVGGADNKYQISTAAGHHETVEQARSWFETYKPILLIFGYISMVTLLAQSGNERFDWMQWMRHFMAGFFLVFSFFKLLNLRGFAESYAMYDVIARRIPAWGYVYAFTELALGIAFLTDFQPFLTNVVTLLVMSISIVGVLQSVLNKRKIQCACLGAVFNLPMSTVTIIEDGLMMVMSAAMLFLMN